jgi:hypothetical protein
VPTISNKLPSEASPPGSSYEVFAES